LIGYYAGMRNNSVIDVAAMEKRAQDLVQYCMAHSEVSVIRLQSALSQMVA
jgi:hypothetical protein